MWSSPSINPTILTFAGQLLALRNQLSQQLRVEARIDGAMHNGATATNARRRRRSRHRTDDTVHANCVHAVAIVAVAVVTVVVAMMAVMMPFDRTLAANIVAATGRTADAAGAATVAAHR